VNTLESLGIAELTLIDQKQGDIIKLYDTNIPYNPP